MSFLRNMKYLLGEYKKVLYVVMFLILIMELIRLASNTFYGKLIDYLVDEGSLAMAFLLAWGGLSLINWVFDGLTDYNILKLLVGLEYLIPVKAVSHLLSLTMHFFDSVGTGKLAKRIEKGTDSLTSLLSTFTWEVISAGIQYVVTTIYLIYLYWYWGVIMLILAPIFISITLLLNKIKNPLREKRHDLYEKAGHMLYQMMGNIMLVKAHALESTEISQYEEVQAEIHKTALKEFGMETKYNVLRGFLITFALFGVLFFGIEGVDKGDVKIGEIVTAMNLAIAASFSLFRLTRILVRFMDNYTAIKRLIRFLGVLPEVVDKEDALDVTSLAGDIVFDKVSFEYPEALDVDQPTDKEKAHEQTVINESDESVKGVKDISLEIPAGSTVAFVGASGSGKTTLMNLLLRFYDPLKGSIKVGGTDIRNYTQESYRSKIAVVLQDSYLFDRSVRENVLGHICSEDSSNVLASKLSPNGSNSLNGLVSQNGHLAGSDITQLLHGEEEFFSPNLPTPAEDLDQEIWQVLHRSHASEFVNAMPDKLDSVIGWRGIRLSGGQKQRLSIAMALMRKPDILILDEATSALDTRSEKEVQKAMQTIQAARSTTTLIIAHRLSTIKHADMIVVMDKGEIVEVGSHEDLMQKECGHYHKMVEVQSM